MFLQLIDHIGRKFAKTCRIDLPVVAIIIRMTHGIQGLSAFIKAIDRLIRSDQADLSFSLHFSELSDPQCGSKHDVVGSAYHLGYVSVTRRIIA